MTPLERLRDAELAKAYWATRDRKVYAVDMTAGDVKKITYKRTIYVRARSPQEAMDWARANRALFSVPARCGFSARLAGPMELGAVEACHGH